MSGKDEFKELLSKEDLLKYIDDMESDQKIDKGTRDTIVRAVTGVIGTDIAGLELNLRVSHSEYIINHAPSSALEQCLSGLPAEILRNMLTFIMIYIEIAVPPNAYIKDATGIEKTPDETREIINRIKEIYTADLQERTKKNLVEDAARLLSDRNVSGRLMLGMGPESRKAYNDAIKGGSNYSFYAGSRGLMFVFGDKNSDEYRPFSYIVPDELADIWLSLTEAEISRCDIIENYAASAANLYGAMKETELLDLIRRYDAEQDSETVSLASMSDKGIKSAIQLRLYDDECSYQLSSDENTGDAYIISNYYREYLANKYPLFDENTYDFHDEICDKPRYIPSKSEFLRYADPEYYEQTPETDELRGYIQTRYGEQLAEFLGSVNQERMRFSEPFIDCETVTEDEELDSMMNELHQLFASGRPFDDMTDVLGERDIEPGDTGELFKFMSAARNNTRSWYNKGHLPDDELELTDLTFNDMDDLQMQMFGQEDESDPSDLSHEDGDTVYRNFPPPDKAIPYRAEIKPGRNDPCPCGSGKKYKKCCGR